MNLTCDQCKNLFEVSEGAAAIGEVNCPKCGQAVTIGGPRDNPVEPAAGDFEDFFEVEQAQVGGVSAPPPPQASKPEAAPPTKIATPPPAAAPPGNPPAAKTDDSLLADFGDFDSLFEDAGKAKTVAPPSSPPTSAPTPPPSPSPSKGAAPAATSVEDLLADFNLDEDPAPPAKSATPPPKPAPAAPPVVNKGASDDLEKLFDDFVDPNKGKPAPAPPPKAATTKDPSKPDADLEELFSEVSEARIDPTSGTVSSGGAEEGDALAEGLGIEFKQRRKKIPKQVFIFGGPALFVILGLTAVGMGKFSSGGFFGWKWGQKPADGYEPPSSGTLKKLAARYTEASTAMSNDNADGYKKAIAEFRDILKTDTRNSPTDARLVEAMLLLNGNAVESNSRAEVDRLIAQSEKYHPGIIEAIRAQGRSALGAADLAKAESFVRKASTLNPKDIDTLVLAGEVAMARSDWDFASLEFQKALEFDPNIPRPKRLLAVVRMQQGKPQEAEALLRALVAGKTPNPASEIELWRLLYSQYGKTNEARQGLEEMIKVKTSSMSNHELGKAWRYLSEISEGANDISGAISALEKATGLDPFNHVNGFKLGKLYLDRKDFEKAAEQFGRASSLSPATPDYSIHRGWALRELGKPDEALNELNKGLEKSPGNILGLYQLGLTQRDLGRLDDAVASLESAIKNDPRHVDSMIALGELYLKKDNFSMATMHLRTALSIAPKSVRAHNALGEVFLTTSKPNEGLAEFKLAEEIDAQNVVVLANIGKANLALGKIDLASDYFQKALALDSTRVETQVALGELQHKKKEYSKALETYRRVLEMRPKDFDTRVKLAQVLIDQQSYQDAVNELLEAAKYNPEYYPTRLNLGIAWRGVGNLDASAEELNKATRIRSDASEGYYEMELTQIYRNDPINAEKSMEKALSLDAKYTDPLIALGEFYDRQNIYSKASEYYKRAEAIDPTNARILLKLAETKRKDEKNAEAKKYYERALKRNPTLADAWVGLGLLAEEIEQTAKARQYYEKARSADPNDPRSYYYLGFIYKNANRKKEALLAFRKYLKLDPQSKEKEDILEEIRVLSQ